MGRAKIANDNAAAIAGQFAMPAAEPAVITIRTPPAQMKYDRPSIIASPGAEVRLIFENMDEMPHNFVRHFFI